MFKDYYLILGISKESTAEDIEKAYKNVLSKMDDKTSPAYYQEVKEAFTVLSNKETKIMYDKELSAFNWSDGFRSHVIKNTHLANIINTLQGKKENENYQGNANEVKVENKEQIDKVASTERYLHETNNQKAVQNRTIEKRPPKQPINNSKGMFRRIFTPSGRIRRTEFFISCLGYLLIYLVLNIMIHIAYETDRTILIYLKIADVVFFILFVFQCIKRCHDWGHTGWFLLIPFMPIFLLFAESDDEVNKYGTNPKFDYDLQIRLL